jgi:outer membrane receptor protein involved in Fe transport
MRIKPYAGKFGAAVWLFVIVACSILLTGQAYAQVAGATLTGTVKDSAGGYIPNSQVVITDVATGVARTVSADGAGLYAAPNLLPGTYEIRVSATGFTTEVQKGVKLTVGAQQVLDFTMRVGQMSQTVEVTTEAPTVELTSSTLSAQVSAATVRELPLNGRSWTDLANLQPGVAGIETQASFAQGADRGNRGFGAQVTISGGRPQQNNYRMDGVSVNDYSNGPPGSVLGGTLGVDAIQEFSVLTSNFSAEYGKSSGGVVNGISRSGTNAFHGSAYEFIRNSAMDARNFFDGATIPPFKRNQFGVSAGGPIRKDKTFIFGDYEGIRQGKGITNVDTVPSLAARTGVLFDSNGRLTDQNNCAFQGWTAGNGCPPSGIPVAPLTSQSQCAPEANGATNHLLAPGQAGFCVDDNAAKYLGLYPSPSETPDPAKPNIAKFRFAGQQVINENFFTIRVDHKFSDKDNLFGTYLFDKTPYTSPDLFDNIQLESLTKRQFGVLEETHIFSSTFTNTVRFGVNREYANNDQSVKALNPLSGDPTLGAVPGKDASLVVVGGGITDLDGGLGSLATWLFRWTSFQAYDDAFLTKGLHSLKFGAGFERMQFNLATLTGPGTFKFPNFNAFLSNQPSQFSSSLIEPGGRGLRQSLVAFYLQDDWRFRPNFNLNLGLRYEMTTVPTEETGKLSTLITMTDQNPHLGDPYFLNPTRRNFEPRIGFSWDPFRNGKTAVRGGFGIFDVLPLPYEFMTITDNAYPFAEGGSVKSKPTKPTLNGQFFDGAFALQKPNAFQQTYVEHQPHRNYVMQWNLNVQREITPSVTAVVGYVGSRGVHQPFRADDVNLVLPTLTPAGYLWPCGPDGNGNPCATGFLPTGTQANPIPSSTINPNNGTVRGVMWDGGSDYHALQIGVTKNISHGLRAQGSYTFAKSIDTSSATLVGDAFGNSVSSLSWFDLKLGRGLSDFDIRRVLVINMTWQVPTLQSASGALAFVANGWELGAIYKANDGVPFTATFGTDGDPLGLSSNDPYDYPNRLSGSGCATLTNPGNPNNYIKTQCFAIPTAPSAAFYNANCDPSQGDASKLQCFNLRGNAGRNILIGPGVSNLDFSLFKNNYIRRVSETFNAQFRAEIFNILNHPNFSPPPFPNNTDIFDSTGSPNPSVGNLISTTTTAREIQLALKFTW